MVFPVVNRMPV